jgi:hypothetical protein
VRRFVFGDIKNDPEFSKLGIKEQQEVEAYTLGAPIQEPAKSSTLLEASKGAARSVIGTVGEIGNRIAAGPQAALNGGAAPKPEAVVPKMAPPSTTLDDILGYGTTVLSKELNKAKEAARTSLPFPGIINAITGTTRPEDKNLPTLVNPLPTAITDAFQSAMGTVKKYLPHNAAKLIEDSMNALPSYPKGTFAPIRQIPQAVRMGRAAIDKVDDAIPRGEPAFVGRPIELTPEMVVNKSGQPVDIPIQEPLQGPPRFNKYGGVDTPAKSGEAGISDPASGSPSPGVQGPPALPAAGNLPLPAAPSNADRVFYRGTVPGETKKIDEPFEAARGKIFAAKTEKGASSYGESIERITAHSDAKILTDTEAEFWKVIGRKRPPNSYIGSAGRKNEKLTDIVNDAIVKAEKAGYDAISFGDADIGTVILNENKFTRGNRGDRPPALPAAPSRSGPLSRMNLKDTSADPMAQDIAERMQGVGEGLPGQIQRRMLEQEGTAAGVQPNLLAKIADDFEAQTMERRKAEGQRGSVQLPGRADISTSTGDAALDQVLSTSATKGIKQRLGELKERLLTSVDFQREIKDQPLLVDNIRIFQAKIGEGYATSARLLTGVMSPLKSAAEKEVFSKIVNLRDMVSRLEDGQSVQGGMTMEQARGGLTALVQRATPGVTEAVNKHFQIVDAIGNEKVALGTMTEEMKRTDYFQHKVLQYGDGGGRGSRQIRVPGKEKVALGSKLDIERKYEEVMYDYIANHEYNKSLQKFVEENAQQLDKTALIQAKRGNDFQLRPGQIIDIDGVRYKGYQFGRNIYPATGAADSAARDGVKRGLDDIGVPIEELEPNAANTKPVTALPLNVAQKFENFTAPQGDSGAWQVVNNVTNAWKGLTINFGGTAYQVMNAIGDVANIYRADMLSPLLMPKAVRMLRGKDVDSKLLVKLAEEMDAINSGFQNKEVSSLRNVPEFARLEGPWGKAKIPYHKTVDGIAALNNWRENVPRMALFLKNAARLEGGLDGLTAQLRRAGPGQDLLPMVEGMAAAKPLKEGGTNIEGLPPVRAAGKIAREVAVDYGKATQFEAKYLRGAMLPFYMWAKENTKGWVNYATKHPGGFASKVLIPWAAMEMWNRTQFGNVESQLSDYQRQAPHIITGWHDKNGKPIIINLRSLPANAAMENLGINKIPNYLGDLMQEKITLGKAARKLLYDTAVAPVKTIGGLTNPLPKTLAEIASNNSWLTGNRIVPKRLEGTPEGTQRYARYGLEAAFRPAREGRLLSDQLQRGTFDPVSARFGLGLPAAPIDLDRTVVNRFYDRFEELDGVKNQANLLVRQGKSDDARKFHSERRPELAEWARYSQTAAALSQLRRRTDLIEADDKLSGVEKEAQASKVRARMATIIRRSMRLSGPPSKQ